MEKILKGKFYTIEIFIDWKYLCSSYGEVLRGSFTMFDMVFHNSKPHGCSIRSLISAAVILRGFSPLIIELIVLEKLSDKIYW